MNVRNDNLKCVSDILDALDESIGTIMQELGKCKARVEHVRRGIYVEVQLSRRAPAILDPMNAPEIVGADKNGDGGCGFRLDDDNG